MTLDLLPDLPDTVHGLKNLDPPTIQCDGCGRLDVGAPGKLALTVILSDIRFAPLRRGDNRRMCLPCWQAVDPHHGRTLR